MRALRPTIRLRLTVTYGLVFLLTGAVLLSIGYVLVRNNIDRPLRAGAALRALTHAPTPRPGFTGIESIARAVRSQLVSSALHRLLVEYLFALGVMTLISVGIGWLLAGRALRPLRDMTATAQRVSGENLGERIALNGPSDELKELADTIDGMLARLDDAFASQRHFVANASHELRTPLAIMRTEVDVALADPGAEVGDLRAMGDAVRETVDRCERLIEGLLVLARSEAAEGREERVDLAPLAADCITDLRARAAEAALDVRADLQPAHARGDARLLERLIANLIDNGIRHNVPGGFLNVVTRSERGDVTLCVANGGPSIDPARVQALAEPFQRLDRSVDGFGLGLSIVRSVAHAHGGRCELIARAEGGLEVRVELPAAPALPSPEPAARQHALTRG
jgi:signal transduction histidine kinase